MEISYYHIEKGTSTIHHACSTLEDALNKCNSYNRTAKIKGWEESSDVISKDNFIKKYGEQAIGLVEE